MQFAIYLLLIVTCSTSQGVLIKSGLEKILTDVSYPQSSKNTAAIFNNDQSQLCTGALIHPFWILTSALCALKVQNHEMRVIIGETITNSTFSTANKIKNYYIYPKFDQESLVGDLALLQLDKRANDDNEILEISNNDDLSITECVVKGYGYSKPDLTGKFSGNMSQSNVRILENSYCSLYPIIMTNKLCTTAVACRGDQGAPLIVPDTNKLIGIVSFKEEFYLCGFQAIPLTLYTYVALYQDWIRSVLDSNL